MSSRPNVQPIIENERVTESAGELLDNGVMHLEDLHKLSKRPLIDDISVPHPDGGFEEGYIDRDTRTRYSGAEHTHKFWILKNDVGYCIVLNNFNPLYLSFRREGWQVSCVMSEHAESHTATWQELFGDPDFKPMFVSREKAINWLRD